MTSEIAAPQSPVPQGGKTDVTIIGAGFIGLCSALWLQAEGWQVTLVDTDPPLESEPWRRAASYGNACTFAPHGVVPVAMPGLVWQVPGMLCDPRGPLAIRWTYLPRLAPWLAAFLLAGRRSRVEGIAARLGALLAGATSGWEPLLAAAGAKHLQSHKGCLYIYQNEAEYRGAAYGNALRAKHGVRMTELGAAEIADLEPALAPLGIRGTLYDDAWTISSPMRLGVLLAELFRSRGGTFLRGKADGLRQGAKGLEYQLNGSTRHASHLVIAAGAWSGMLARQLGDHFRLDTERGYHVLFPEAAGLLSRPVCFTRHGFYMTPMADGLRAAGTVEFGGLQAAPDPRRSEVIRREVGRLLPSAGEASSTWMGFRPSMPDSLPVICKSERVANVTYAFGHGHLGLTLGGVTGQLVADLVSGRAARISETRPVPASLCQ